MGPLVWFVYVTIFKGCLNWILEKALGCVERCQHNIAVPFQNFFYKVLECSGSFCGLFGDTKGVDIYCRLWVFGRKHIMKDEMEALHHNYEGLGGFPDPHKSLKP